MGCSDVCKGCSSKSLPDIAIPQTTRDWFSKLSTERGGPQRCANFLRGYRTGKGSVINWVNHLFYKHLSDEQKETVRGAEVLANIEILRSADNPTQQVRAISMLSEFFCHPKLESIVNDAVGNNEEKVKLLLS